MENQNTKSSLLRLLEQNREGYLSGEEMAEGLGISRAAVWKAVKALRARGVQVESAPGLGYRLAPGSDALTLEALRVALEDPVCPARVLETVDSTNLEAKRWALEGAPHGALVVAARQSAGRGRLGRSFQSPPGGLYMSMVLRPQAHQGQSAVLVTTAAAVAACRAVSALCGIELSIKWVNDLFLGEKKVCGILTEAGTGVENGAIEYMVVGIGINHTTRPEEFPPGVAELASSLFPDGHAPVTRARLAAGIVRELARLFSLLPDAGFLQEYRRRSMALGRQVQVLASPPWWGRAVEIDDAARLVVEKPNGERVALSYGEISIKL